MTDPNVYWGSGKGGSQVSACNLVAAFGVDNTGATDCSTDFQVGLTALSTPGMQAAWLPAGTYLIENNLQLAGNNRFEGTSGTSCEGAFTGGGIYNAIFVSQATFTANAGTVNGAVATVGREGTWSAGAAVALNQLTIPTTANATGLYYTVTNAGSGTMGAAQPTWPIVVGASTAPDANGVVWTCTGSLLYASTIAVTGFATEPAVGHAIVLQHGSTSSRMAYDVLAITGSGGSYVITTDRPNVWLWSNGDTATEISAYPADVEINGHGMRLSGDEVQLIETAYTKRFKLADIVCSASYASVVGSPIGLDFGTRESLVSDVDCTHNDNSAALYLQSNERTIVQRLLSNAGGAAINFQDCYQCGADDCWSYNSTVGNDFNMLAINPGTSFGNYDCWFRGGGVVNSVGLSSYNISYSVRGLVEGVYIEGGNNGVSTANDTDTVIRSLTATQINGAAVNVGATSTRVTAERIIVNGAEYGIQVASGAVGTRLLGAYISGCSGNGILANADLAVTNLEGLMGVTDGNLFISCNAGTLTIEEANIAGQAHNGTAIEILGTAVGKFSNVRVALTTATNQTAFYCSAGSIYLEYCSATGPASSVGIQCSHAGSVVNIGPGCSFDGTGTPIAIASSGVVTMVQTGGVAQIAGAAGTTKMTFAQHYCNSIEIGLAAPIATGTQTLNALAAFIGQQFVVKNYNTTGSITNVFGLVIPPTSEVILRCNAAGTWEVVNSTILLTQNVTLAQLQAKGATATGTFNVGAVLPAGARLVNISPEIIVTQAFAATGLTTVIATVQGGADGAGTLGTASPGTAAAASYGCITPTNPYMSRATQQITVTVTLGGALLNGLTAGAFTVNVLYEIGA